ncbi:MAG: c-type cytochrome [Betaproteobacteria bacterium]|nr:c-type cytochrome [Betaproteobacteria bacterium]MDH5219764.1 c-type cytochrome [Betaproteobacteria bacterium]MDH5352510.1 c-type cytochrome [Betaproteobacteria bacterium]
MRPRSGNASAARGRARPWGTLALAAASLPLLWTCAAWQPGEDWTGPHPYSTFQKFLARARAGDAESQNAVAYMLYHGEGVPRDVARAREWFERAAQSGSERARRNLASLAAGPDPDIPRRPAAGRDVGRDEQLYLAFCSGCHGVNGVAAYENSPSFAFGERLEKGDAQLLRSLSEGSQEMPGWGDKLTHLELREVLAFVRTLHARYDNGVRTPLRAPPSVYYLFGPMEQRSPEARPALR